jgi:hypothetical protein
VGTGECGSETELNEGLPLARRWAAASLARILVALGDPGAAEVLAQVQRAPLPERGVPLHYTTGTWLMHAAEAMASSEIPWDWNRVLELCETICDRGSSPTPPSATSGSGTRRPASPQAE